MGEVEEVIRADLRERSFANSLGILFEAMVSICLLSCLFSGKWAGGGTAGGGFSGSRKRPRTGCGVVSGSREGVSTACADVSGSRDWPSTACSAVYRPPSPGIQGNRFSRPRRRPGNARSPARPPPSGNRSMEHACKTYPHNYRHMKNTVRRKRYLHTLRLCLGIPRFPRPPAYFLCVIFGQSSCAPPPQECGRLP